MLGVSDHVAGADQIPKFSHHFLVFQVLGSRSSTAPRPWRQIRADTTAYKRLTALEQVVSRGNDSLCLSPLPLGLLNQILAMLRQVLVPVLQAS